MRVRPISILALVFLSTFSGILFGVPAVSATTCTGTSAIDFPSVTEASGTTTTGNITMFMTTACANEVIVIGYICQQQNPTAASSQCARTPTDTSSLTWYGASGFTSIAITHVGSGNNTYVTNGEFYAISSGILNNDVITLHGNVGHGALDASYLAAFALGIIGVRVSSVTNAGCTPGAGAHVCDTGCNPSGIICNDGCTNGTFSLGPPPSCPATNPPHMTMNWPHTHSTNSFLFAFATNNGTSSLSTPPGFTQAIFANNGASSPLKVESALYYLGVTANQTNLNAPISFSGNGKSFGGWVTWAIPLLFPPIPTVLTAVLTNPDCGNCVIAGNGKFYNFVTNVSSQAIFPGTNGNVTHISLYFNDSIHNIQVQYDALTNTTASTGDEGSITLGATHAKDDYIRSFPVDILTVTFNIEFNNAILQSSNRSLYLSGCIAPTGGGICSSQTLVQNNYFNILVNGGGLANEKSKGTCSRPAGNSVFGISCSYNGSPKSSMQVNDTWVNLQSYSTQFSLVPSTSGNPNSFLWQTYPNSVSGGEVSSNPKDWTIRIGFYFWDNSSSMWVLGPNVRLYLINGNQGNNDEWTILRAEYYFGHTLISNQSMTFWIEQNPVGQVRIFTDIWYSSVNASTTWGMRVNAYYVGMHESGNLIWATWGPLFANASTSASFGSIYNHAGKLWSATQIECTKVFWNMTRFGVPGVHTNQPNFTMTSGTFAIEQFNLANSFENMQGVNTPIYTQPLVPIIASTSGLLSPIYAALLGLGGFIVKAFLNIGNVIWNGLGTRFPWFTSTISTFSSLIVNFSALLIILAVYLIDILKFLYGIVGLVFIPITVIINAYTFIQAAYLPIFGGVKLSAIIEIFVLVFFSSAMFDWMENGETGKIIQMVAVSWAIINTILLWTWRLAKLLIDSIEGLIP